MSSVQRPEEAGDPSDAAVPASEPPATRPVPGEHRLARPPSDRYAATDTEPGGPISGAEPGASVGRGVVLAIAAGLLGSGLLVLLGGVVTITAGLVIAAGAIGWAVTAGLRFGAGDRIGPDRRVAIAVTIALGSIALGQLGLWLYAQSEGGVLSPIGYVTDVFGILVPIEFGVAAIIAWWGAR